MAIELMESAVPGAHEPLRAAHGLLAVLSRDRKCS